MVQRLANACSDVDASIDDLNFYAAHAQKAARESFCRKLVASVEFFARSFLSRRFQRCPSLRMKRLEIRLCLCKMILLIVR